MSNKSLESFKIIFEFNLDKLLKKGGVEGRVIEKIREPLIKKLEANGKQNVVVSINNEVMMGPVQLVTDSFPAPGDMVLPSMDELHFNKMPSHITWNIVWLNEYIGGALSDLLNDDTLEEIDWSILGGVFHRGWNATFISGEKGNPESIVHIRPVEL